MIQFFNRLMRSQSGGIIISTLIVTGLISLGVGLYQFRKKAEKTLEQKVDITKYDDIKASGDPGKDQEKNSAGFVEVMIVGGETVVGSYDETGMLTVMDKMGTFKSGDDTGDTKQDEGLRSELKKKGLSDDKFMVDTAKIIKKQVQRRTSSDYDEAKANAIVADIMEEIEEDIEALGLGEDEDIDYSGIDDLELLDGIEQVLEAEGEMEDKETIALKKKLASLLNSKKYLENKIGSSKKYNDMGYSISTSTGLNELEDRLEGVNEQIAEISEKLGIVIQDAAKVTLSGQGDLLGFTESNITLTIDLKTGVVTGRMTCYGHQPYAEDNSIYCRYKFDSDLNGTIDLSTYKLSAKASGYVNGISGGVCGGLKSTQYSTTLSGTLNEAATSISGASSMGGSWSASR